MQVVRAFDSCFVATYKMFSGKQQNVSNAAAILAFAFFFYWVDIVAALDYSGALADLGWRARNVIFIGGVCIGITHLFIYIPRAPRILGDESLASSQFRLFRYVFFCSPAVIFFILIFLEIRLPRILG